MSSTKFLLILLFFPVLLVGWITYWQLWGKNQAKQEKQKKEWIKKVSTHLKNFSPTRLKNKTWQKSIGKYKKKRKNLPKEKQK